MSTLAFVDVPALTSAGTAVAVSEPVEATIRQASATDAGAIHALIVAHAVDGRLLPRSLDEIARRTQRFLVAEHEGRIVACIDLAPLSTRVAEVRSLVTAHGARSCGIGRKLVEALEQRALASGFEMLCAFTHAPQYFVQLGFSIVPHTWLPEKIDADCRSCAQFRQCGQYAVMLPLVSAGSTGRGRHAHA
jgi:N-acetylglutamate synthase-like GNAT family acetyltransferase